MKMDQRPTILIVDDSVDDQVLYQRAFKDIDHHYNLVIATSAEAGLACIVNARPEPQRPNLILLDYNLPDMDGLSFMKKLAEYSLPPIPIVMLTGEGRSAVAVEVMKSGADDYLVKDAEGVYLRLLPGVVGRVFAAYQQREQNRLLQHETAMLLRRNQALLQNSMEGIRILDVDGNVIEANDAFCNMLGYTRDEILRLNVTDWDAQWSREELRERFKALVGHSARFETVHKCKDGTLIHVEVTSCGIEMDGKSYLYASSRDITERKLAGMALLKSEANLRAMLDNSPYLTWLKDAEGRYLTINKVFADYLRLENVRDAIGKTDLDLQQKELAEKYRVDDAEVMAARRQKHVEEQAFDGSRIHWVETFKTPIIDTHDNVLGTVGFARDITERKNAEAMLKKHKLVIDHANDGFWLTDKTGNLLEANVAYANMSGYTIAELTKMHISQLEAREQPEDVRVHTSKIIAQGHDRFETCHRRKDGKVIDIEVSATYMPEEQHFFVFCRDITERKKAEDALRVAAVAFETHDAILITDSRANIIRVNRAFTDITGYNPEEVLGQNPRIMSSGRHDHAFYLEMWQQLLHTGSWAGEIFDRRKNGQIYPKWMTITAVRNEGGITTNYVAIFSDITARKQADEEIRNLAFYDALTRLPNRRLLMDRFRAALTISMRRNDYGAVLFIDLDRFKTLNDTLGHDYGDLLLIEVAARIKACVREMDTVARMGGDEFVVLIEGVSEDKNEASHNVGLIAEKIRDTLARPYLLKTHEHHCSPSIGISLYRGNENSVDELIRQADMAMYQSKESGRNAVRFFDPVMQYNVASRAALENDLHHALKLGQLQLHYQIQVDNEHRAVGAEVLLRWIHPQRGTIMPAQFIPIAEESTLILEIGYWVLEQSCGQLALWAGDKRMRDLTLAVNVSAKQFSRPNFVEQVGEVVSLHHIAPGRLKLELTESMVLHDLKNTTATMHALKKLGVKLSMDDFGTGYSSLSYLRELPLDQLKIDQSFVQGITRDGNDALLVQTIIDLAGNFHMNVIAEGVETEAQLTFLKHHDCMAYQGFLFGKAVPLGEFEVLMACGEETGF